MLSYKHIKGSKESDLFYKPTVSVDVNQHSVNFFILGAKIISVLFNLLCVWILFLER